MPRILLVDDHEPSLFITSALLAQHDYLVETAINGRDALEKAKSNPPDLILSDVFMPVMDGFTLCKEIKRHSRLRQIPFIFFSSTFISENDKKFGYELGASAYILKIQEPNDFIRELNSVLENTIAASHTETSPGSIDEAYRLEYREAVLGKLQDKIAQLEQSNRRLAMLNEFNQAIVLSADEPTLLDATCRIIVEIGKYRLAWIGFRRPAGSPGIQPVAQRGFPPGYLDSRRIDWTQSLLRQDPSVLAIRTGSQALVRKVETKTEPEAWYREALDLGYASAFILPLRRSNGNILGVLNIYAERNDAFDKEEKDLLIRLGDNLAYGIHALRERQELKQTGDALRREKEFTDTVLDAQKDTFFLFEPATGKAIRWNKAFREISGYNDDEIARMPAPQSYYSPEDLERAGVFTQKVMKNLTGSIELDLICKDGSTVSTEYRVSVIDDDRNESRYFISIGRDITERKKAQVEQERLRLAIEQASEVIVITDADATIQYVNPAFERITGYRADEVVGRNPNLLRSGKQDDGFYRQMWQTLLRGETWTGKIMNRKKDGTLFTEEVSISPVRNSQYRTVNYVAVKRDITREMKLEEQLRQAQKMEALGTLAGGIAHDFNNILSVILGYAELARLEMPGGCEADADLRKVLQAGNRAKNLVKQILTFSRQTEQELKPLRIQLVLKEAVNLLRSSIPTTITIHHDIDPECGTVLADPTQIHQVIMNLCTNAYHSMRKSGGTLGISLKPAVLSPGEAAGRLNLQPGSYVKLIIRDTGCGIPTEHLEKIFNPYFTTKVKGEGTGLGLAIVHGIIFNYGGNISVYSEVGKGTAFEIYLPVIDDNLEHSPEDAGELIPTGTESILVVDDDEDIIQMLRRMLEPLGYRVTALSDSISALKRFRESPDDFHLVLTDMTMPRMTGAELGMKILAIRPGIPIILCTGYSDQLDPEELKRIGIRDVVMKPVLLHELATLIREILDPSTKKRHDER